MKKMLIVDDASGWRRHHEAVIRSIFPNAFEIDTADSAYSANELLYLNVDAPYDVILTDMQMESDFLPLYAGEWLIEQIQKIGAYKNAKIIIISASPSIRLIAENYHVDYIPKQYARNTESYKNLIDVEG